MRAETLRGVTIVVCIIIVTVLSGDMFAHAAELDKPVDEEIAAEYKYTVSASTNLSMSGEKAIASAKIIRKASADRVKVKMNLQKKKGDSWDTIETWGMSSLSRITYLKKTKTISRGTYRVYTKFTTFTGNQSETKKIYSAEKSIEYSVYAHPLETVERCFVQKKGGWFWTAGFLKEVRPMKIYM